MTPKQTIFFILGVIVAILALTWLIEGNEFFLYKFFAPKQEAVRREVFEQSKAYNQGMINELRQYQMDYTKGTAEQKAMMKTLIIRQADQIKVENLPPDLANFVNDLKTNVAKTEWK